MAPFPAFSSSQHLHLCCGAGVLSDQRGCHCAALTSSEWVLGGRRAFQWPQSWAFWPHKCQGGCTSSTETWQNLIYEQLRQRSDRGIYRLYNCSRRSETGRTAGYVLPMRSTDMKWMGSLQQTGNPIPGQWGLKRLSRTIVKGALHKLNRDLEQSHIRTTPSPLIWGRIRTVQLFKALGGRTKN